MKSLLLIFFFSIAFIFLNDLKAQKYEFVISKTNDNSYYKVTSCNDISIYRKNLILPKKPNHAYLETTKNERVIQQEIPLVIPNAFWEEDCLIFPYEKVDFEGLIDMVQQISILEKEQILITFK